MNRRATNRAARTGLLAAGIAALAAAPIPASATPPGSSGGPPEIYALVVGYNGGRPGLPDLRYADDDAARFALFFAGLAGARQPPRVWLLTDLDPETVASLRAAHLTPPQTRAPTRAGLMAAITEIRQQLASRSGGGEVVLYFVYAGHGLQGRILLKPDGAPEAAITGRELRVALADLPVDHTLMFLDACRSQSLFSERGPADAELGPDLSAQVSDLERRADAVRIGVLTAAATGKPAGEVRSLQAGYFSHVLASGLAGAADADGDDVVSFGELAAFVAFNTERLTGQRPWFEPPGGDLSVRAIDHRGRAPRMVFAAPAAGRYLVEASSGHPIFVEAFKDRRRALKLTLPPGRYRVRQLAHGGTRAGVADVELTPGQVLQVADSAWHREDAAAVTQRDAQTDTALTDNDDGGADPAGLAFSNPFTPDVVSTLAAGYRAGREPSVVTSLRDSLAMGVSVGPGPLSLGGGRETTVALSYRHRRAWGLFGVRAEVGTSSQFGGGESYRLARSGLLLEAGARWKALPSVELSATGASGFKTALRLAGDTSGDLWGPVVSAGVGLAAQVVARLFVTVDLRYGVHWIEIDGARRASWDPTLGVGVGIGF